MTTKKLHLNVHLLRANCTDFAHPLTSRAQALAHKHLAEPKIALPFEARLLLEPPTPRSPRWLGFVEDAFPLPVNGLHNQMANALLLLKAGGRMFAVSFGYGGNALDRAHLELDFGKRIVLNILDDDRLRTVDSRTIEHNTLQRRAHRAQAGRLRDLRLDDLDQEWVRSVAGSSLDQRLLGKVEGGDTVKLAWPGRIDQLDQLCAQLLTIFNDDAWRKKFPELDRLRPIKEGTPEHAALTAKLLQRFRPSFKRDGILLAFPELPDPRLAQIEFRIGRVSSAPYDDLTVDALAAFLGGKGDVDPAKVSVYELDANGDTLRNAPLMEYLQLEESHDGGQYLLSLGTWFRVDADYVAEVERAVRRIPDVTVSLALRDWQKSEADEEAYNIELSKARGWVLLDKNLQHYKKRQKIEACDHLAPPSALATPVPGLDPGVLLIAVKDRKCRSSAAGLSHLFAQGVVSMEMMRDEKALRDRVFKDYHRAYGLTMSLDDTICVFAIADGRNADVTSANPAAECLTLFSKVNLLNQVRAIQRMGGQVALCRIQRHEDVAAKAPRPKKPRGKKAPGGGGTPAPANTTPASKAA